MIGRLRHEVHVIRLEGGGGGVLYFKPNPNPIEQTRITQEQMPDPIEQVRNMTEQLLNHTEQGPNRLEQLLNPTEQA